MGLLDSQLASDALAFADADTFGELLTYNPAGSGTTPISFTGVVFREEMQGVPGQSSGYVAPKLMVFVPAGVGITKITPRGDTITLAVKIGGTPEKVPVTRVMSEDPGGWSLQLI